MQDYQELLKLIEEVDQKDTVAMDKIDRAVCLWLKSPERRKRIENGIVGLYHIPKYTRSRDALKAIRPEGWLFNICNLAEFFECELFTTEGDDPFSENAKVITFNGKSATEELAELHAIIQAIAYERNK